VTRFRGRARRYAIRVLQPDLKRIEAENVRHTVHLGLDGERDRRLVTPNPHRRRRHALVKTRAVDVDVGDRVYAPVCWKGRASSAEAREAPRTRRSSEAQNETEGRRSS